ncbi:MULTISPECIES: FAD-dependent oxidoreductase [Burkholderia]|uniref:FAD-dependent oxidoreductase n=1 Tax=Burkholderia contaminans TaxID=488447 RepID=A0A2S5E6M0_9BURK|nr:MULTISPECIES: FAD-dependent oxidoreductase [Burkholderia]EKS9796663.1 FAD-dependent monooxygenase [Burkholderia cepacia]EKS9802472.1 FAD-dependent monooxygenase [Burkholderia cepacia]EKS9809786.1 FAD-dependent monooxygenase [Burkholderia cepacia]EKS9818457.1 FAD-dependent monooxygenase [Burkholderia cepacia]EKS9824356.1 FAD-dependent monooxygenase [Burkholderia cepacia]
MDIAILGAGVAGMSTALALGRQGHRIRLYERRPSETTMGAGVVLWPNAGFVLEQLGLLPDIVEVSGHLRAMRCMDRDGTPFKRVDIGELDRYMGFPTRSILRRDLQAVLARHVAAHDIEVCFGHCATAIDTGTDGRTVVHFDNGVAITPDLAIGADGRMNSVARRYVVGNATPVYQGFVNWIGVAQSDVPLVDDVSIFDYWGQRERFGIVAVDRHRMYWAAARAEAEIDDNDSNSDAAAPDDPGRLLERLFDGWPAPIADVMRATPPGSIAKIRVHDLDPVDVWHRGNVLLIGDAAHAPLPTSGQGACQALEDAWHLARCLDEHGKGNGSDLDAALASFTLRRSRKTTAITLRAREFARRLFGNDTHEAAQEVDPIAEIEALANAWGAGLPMMPARD